MKPGDWKLVTDMAELRVGMTCKVDPCPKCGSKHILTVAEHLAGGGVRFVEVVHGQTRSFGPNALSDDADGVYRRNFFRLITDNDDEAEQKVGRSMENGRLIAVARVAVGEVKRRLAAGGGER